MAGGPQRLLTTGEVARISGFSASAVLQWVRAGKLPSFSSPGGQYRIAPDALARFLKQHGMHVPKELEKVGPARVLVVDDDRLVRNIIVRMLKECNMDIMVDVAENGVIGCIKVPLFRPHLIILDIVMPEVDGAEVCRTIKKTPQLSDIKILLVTGHPDDPRFRNALAMGAEDWLAKPLRFDAFRARVAMLLGIEPPLSAEDFQVTPFM